VPRPSDVGRPPAGGVVDTPSAGVATTKAERTRERLISAAAVTLSRLGYAGTRLVDVAEEAGLQAPAIYYHFESREQLIEEVVVVGTVRLREFVAAALAAAPSDATPLERLDIAVEAHLRQLMAQSGFAHAVIRNRGQLPDAIRRRQSAAERPYVAIWRELFRAAAEDGSLRADLDPDLARLLIIGILNWATEWWTPRRGSLDEVIATAQSVIRNGVAG
jgi:AcrR family transcriptional regulator